MKKILLPLFTILLFNACQKQISTDKTSEEIAGSVANKQAKITVCHYDAVTNTSRTITITLNAWPQHQAHGDVRLDDQDGDGYVPDNACDFGRQGDCNDNNIAINPSATEICGNNIDDNCDGQTDENCFVIGADYQGGKIAYILQPGDPGYVASETHGLIAAPSDQSGTSWGCFGTILVGADGTAIGSGNQNTMDIMSGCSTEGIAARICGDLVLNAYSDWYLPSKDELNKLFINREAIGSFSMAGDYYWSSSESWSDQAWAQEFPSGAQNAGGKSNILHLRAVRSF